MEIGRKIMINKRYTTVSPGGLNSDSISPGGFNRLSVSPGGFNSFLIFLILAFSFKCFSQTEGKYDVIINKNSKITFTGFTLNKSEPYYGYKKYEVLAPTATIQGANNGLSVSGQNVQLGGDLLQNTNINQNGFNLTTTGLGSIGIGINTGLLAKMHVVSSTGNTALFKSNNGGGGYAVRGESINIGVATGVWGELGAFDAGLSLWSGARGNSSTPNMPAVMGIQTVTNGVSGYFNQRVGIGVVSPTARLAVSGEGTGQMLVGSANFGTGNYTGISMNGTLSSANYNLLSGTDDQNLYINRPTGGLMLFRQSNVDQMVLLANGNLGIGTTSPHSKLHIGGSFAEEITIITTTTTVTANQNKLLVNNGASNITILLPNPLNCVGRKYEISRYQGSTGIITVSTTGTNQIQSLNGNIGLTTTISVHGATGQGLSHSFTAVNIGGVGVWVRL
jgi:hypothetical protein